jgi:hypothetical protein
VPTRSVQANGIKTATAENGITLINIQMFRGKNRLSHEIFLLLFEGNLRKLLPVFSADAFTNKQLWYF